MKYNHVALGGTFDHLHSGHKALLHEAFLSSQNVTIGLTQIDLHSDKFLVHTIQSYKERENELKNYINNNFPESVATIIPITDIYGTTLIDASFDALVVTDDTTKNGLKINEERLRIKMSSLDLISVPFIKGNDGLIISSTRIRLGEIDRDGFSYEKLFSKKITISSSLREKLATPMGIIFKGDENNLDIAGQKTVEYLRSKPNIIVITVGDIVTASLFHLKFEPNIQIIDFKTQRKHLSNTKADIVYDLVNPPGTISSEFLSLFKNSLDAVLNLNMKKTVSVDGEEDLLTLPTVLLAPLESVVLYGQTNYGIILLEVTESLKNNLRMLF